MLVAFGRNSGWMGDRPGAPGAAGMGSGLNAAKRQGENVNLGHSSVGSISCQVKWE